MATGSGNSRIIVEAQSKGDESVDDLLKRYIECAEYVVQKCRSLGHIKGAAKLERKCLAELKYLQSLGRRRTHFDISHLRSSNLSHYLAVVHAAENLPDVTQILQAFMCPGRSDSLHVDVVAGQGHMWVKVIARKAQALHLIWAGQGQFGERDIQLQADDYVLCASVHPVNFVEPKVIFVFYNGITVPMATKLREARITVLGNEVGVNDDVERKLATISSDVSDDESVGSADIDDDVCDTRDVIDNNDESRICQLMDIARIRSVDNDALCKLSGNEIDGDRTHGPDKHEELQTCVISRSDVDVHETDVFVRSRDDHVVIQDEGTYQHAGADIDISPLEHVDVNKQVLALKSDANFLASTATYVDCSVISRQPSGGKIETRIANQTSDKQTESRCGIRETNQSANIKTMTGLSPDAVSRARRSDTTIVLNAHVRAETVLDNIDLADYPLEKPMSDIPGIPGSGSLFPEHGRKLATSVPTDGASARQCCGEIESQNTSLIDVVAQLDTCEFGSTAPLSLITHELLVSPMVNYRQLRDSVMESAVSFVDSVARINLDITALITMVSSVSHGRCHFEFKEEILSIQAADERRDPVLPKLERFIEGKELFACQTAINSFKSILALLGGETECRRAEELLKRVKVVPDKPSFRAESLPNTGKIKARSKIVFGTGDSLKAVTMTANSGFVRAAENQGALFSVFIHASRALTEQKEPIAEGIGELDT